MKLIRPSFEIIEQAPGYEGVLKQIELAGRTCYKSENRITKDSAEKFVEMLKKSGHGAMLEHGTVYLKDTYDVSAVGGWRRCLAGKYEDNGYSVVRYDGLMDIRGIYITTNLRVLVDHGWLDDLEYICEPTEYHDKRATVRFTCDRGVSHEFVRHRVFSFAQESTRYCNYSKDKFGNELTFIVPCWEHGRDKAYQDALYLTETAYFKLLKDGWTPQQARSILPNALKTELVMTGFISDWWHFFKLRDDSHAHPQARELAAPLHQEFIKRGYLY